MAYKRYSILETQCPECQAIVRVYQEGDFQTLEQHVRRDAISHNLTQCSQSRALVTTHVRTRDLIVCGV